MSSNTPDLSQLLGAASALDRAAQLQLLQQLQAQLAANINADTANADNKQQQQKDVTNTDQHQQHQSPHKQQPHDVDISKPAIDSPKASSPHSKLKPHTERWRDSDNDSGRVPDMHMRASELPPSEQHNHDRLNDTQPGYCDDDNDDDEEDEDSDHDFLMSASTSVSLNSPTGRSSRTFASSRDHDGFTDSSSSLRLHGSFPPSLTSSFNPSSASSTMDGGAHVQSVRAAMRVERAAQQQQQQQQQQHLQSSISPKHGGAPIGPSCIDVQIVAASSPSSRGSSKRRSQEQQPLHVLAETALEQRPTAAADSDTESDPDQGQSDSSNQASPAHRRRSSSPRHERRVSTEGLKEDANNNILSPGAPSSSLYSPSSTSSSTSSWVAPPSASSARSRKTSDGQCHRSRSSRSIEDLRHALDLCSLSSPSSSSSSSSSSSTSNAASAAAASAAASIGAAGDCIAAPASVSAMDDEPGATPRTRESSISEEGRREGTPPPTKAVHSASSRSSSRHSSSSSLSLSSSRPSHSSRRSSSSSSSSAVESEARRLWNATQRGWDGSALEAFYVFLTKQFEYLSVLDCHVLRIDQEMDHWTSQAASHDASTAFWRKLVRLVHQLKYSLVEELSAAGSWGRTYKARIKRSTLKVDTTAVAGGDAATASSSSSSTTSPPEYACVKVVDFEGIELVIPGVTPPNGRAGVGAAAAAAHTPTPQLDVDDEPPTPPPVQPRQLLREEVDRWCRIQSAQPEESLSHLLRVYPACLIGEHQFWMGFEMMEPYGSLEDVRSRWRKKSPDTRQVVGPTPKELFMPERLVARIMKDALIGLSQLYQHLLHSDTPGNESDGEAHGSIHLSNLLLSSSGRIKVSDRAAAPSLDATFRKGREGGGGDMMMRRALTFPPEMLTMSNAPKRPGDVWQLGIAAIELFDGQAPHAHYPHPMRAIMLIPRAPSPTLKFASLASDEFNDFIATCCNKDLAARATVAQLMNHPFILQADETTPDELVRFAQEQM